MTSSPRRDELLDLALDHAGSAGLIGLTLRPLAAAIGTSDRMLLYHFGSRDALVAAIVTRSTERGITALDRLPGAPDVRAGVLALHRAYQDEPLCGTLALYIQAAATGLIGQEPYLSLVRDSNADWVLAIQRYLLRCGAPAGDVSRIVTLVDSSLFGFQLDLVTDRDDELAAGVEDLAEAAQSLVTR